MKLLVIDGNSIVNRAYYGMHPLNNQEGFPTHAIYGFLNILRRIREEVDPDGGRCGPCATWPIRTSRGWGRGCGRSWPCRCRC